MPNLITAYNHAGIAVRLCDARCYESNARDCNCVCSGHAHAKGLPAATLAVAKHATQIKHAASHAGLPRIDFGCAVIEALEDLAYAAKP